MASIRDIQVALKAAGFDPGPIDGLGGAETTAAVTAFQTANGLKADGIIGAITLSRLLPDLTRDVGGLITAKVLASVTPQARKDVATAIVSRPDKFVAAGITSPLRSAHFLAQIATESGAMTVLTESLNYSVEGLLKTFSRARISAADCAALGRKPGRPADQEAIANVLYGGSFGKKQLGNTQAGDGWRYRGSGLIQVTGRANFRSAGFEDNPDALREVPGALDASLAYWVMNGLNALADTDDLKAVRRRINPGLLGLNEAEKYLIKSKAALM